MNCLALCCLVIVQVDCLHTLAGSTVVRTIFNDDSKSDAVTADENAREEVRPKDGSEQKPAGASRADFGIPIDPLPATRIFYQPTHDEIDKKLVTGATQSVTITKKVTIRPDYQEGWFHGMGVLIDKHHVLTNHASFYNSSKFINPRFSQIGFGQPSPEIDVRQPGQDHYTQSSHRLVERMPFLNKTNLGVYEVQTDFEPKTTNDKPVVLETNPHEYGQDCFVHGYGKVHPYQPGATVKGIDNADFYASTKRRYVKAPVLQVKPSDCDDSNACNLQTEPNGGFCPDSGAGSPVFCGNEQKLTYMAQYKKDVGYCSDTFHAYHIPRLVGAMHLANLPANG